MEREVSKKRTNPEMYIAFPIRNERKERKREGPRQGEISQGYKQRPNSDSRSILQLPQGLLPSKYQYQIQVRLQSLYVFLCTRVRHLMCYHVFGKIISVVKVYVIQNTYTSVIRIMHMSSALDFHCVLQCINVYIIQVDTYC